MFDSNFEICIYLISKLKEIVFSFLSFFKMVLDRLILLVAVLVTWISIVLSNPIIVTSSSSSTPTNTTTAANNDSNRNLPRMRIRPVLAVDLDVECRLLKPKCTCNLSNSSFAANEIILTCANFTDFAQLDFKSTLNATSLVFHIIRIVPLREQPLTETNLDLDGLTLGPSGTVELANINSFDLRANPLAKLKTDRGHFTTILRLVNSTFKFVVNNSIELNSTVCTTALFNANNSTRNLFAAANFLYLDRARFVEPVCPLVFQNSRISNMYVIAPDPPHSSLRFINLTLSDRLHKADAKTNTTVLNSRIKHLFFVNATFRVLDAQVLNKFVFYNLKEVWLQNVHVESMREKVSFQPFF